jgi:hypothetical protein
MAGRGTEGFVGVGETGVLTSLLLHPYRAAIPVKVDTRTSSSSAPRRLKWVIMIIKG